MKSRIEKDFDLEVVSPVGKHGSVVAFPYCALLSFVGCLLCEGMDRLGLLTPFSKLLAQSDCYEDNSRVVY